MKETVHTKSSFKSQNAEQIKKAVTEKMAKLINSQRQKAS